MASSIKLVRLGDFAADIDSLDLMAGLSSATGIVLVRDGWTQGIAGMGAESVTEVFTLRVKGSSTNDLATKIQALDLKVRQVAQWIETPGIEKYSVWLRVQMNNESNARQALVLGISGKEITALAIEAQLNSEISYYTLTIERMPYWEDPYAYPTTTTLSGVDCNFKTSGTQLIETINGDTAARLAKIALTSASGNGQTSRIWIGFKTSRYGNPANFVPYWPFASYYDKSSDVTVTNDGVGHSLVTCNFNTGDAMAERLNIPVMNISPSHPADQRGSYAVLMRAKVDSGTVVRARIRHALGIATLAYTPNYRNRTPITPAVPDYYDIFDMGSVSIPAQQASASDDLSNFFIALDVERVSGSGSFYGYGFHLIPDEAMIKIIHPSATGSMTDTSVVWQHAGGDLVSYQQVAGLNDNSYSVQPVNWGLPANGERPYMICVANNMASISNYVSFNVAYTYIPRWRTLRGSAA